MGFDDLPRLRQPEYTGENRCLPCTAVNLLLAGVGGVVLALAVGPVAGTLAFGAGALLVYLRGYLVPGTPTLTRRYFPPWLLRAFGKEPLDADAVGTVHDAERGPDGDGDVDDPLAAAGVVVRDDDAPTADAGPDLHPAFREAWRERMAAVDGIDPADVAAAFDADSAKRHGETSFALDGSASLRWGSRAALLADVTATDLLDERLETWPEYDRDDRRSLLMGLRLCLESCPSCGGAVRVEEDRVDPCCQKPHLVAEAVCADCGAVLADAAVVDSGDGETVRASLLQT